MEKQIRTTHYYVVGLPLRARGTEKGVERGREGSL